LLDAGDLALRAPQLNDEPARDDDGAQREETKVGDGIGQRVLVHEPQPDRKDGNSDERNAKE